MDALHAINFGSNVYPRSGLYCDSQQRQFVLVTGFDVYEIDPIAFCHSETNVLRIALSSTTVSGLFECLGKRSPDLSSLSKKTPKRKGYASSTFGGNKEIKALSQQNKQLARV